VQYEQKAGLSLKRDTIGSFQAKKNSLKEIIFYAVIKGSF